MSKDYFSSSVLDFGTSEVLISAENRSPGSYIGEVVSV